MNPQIKACRYTQNFTPSKPLHPPPVLNPKYRQPLGRQSPHCILIQIYQVSAAIALIRKFANDQVKKRKACQLTFLFPVVARFAHSFPTLSPEL